jgi:hypothetical protein
MTARVFADELEGVAWDRVRAVRKGLYGGDRRGVALTPELVPSVFHHLLPYASLLTTGEEGAFLDFWDVLDAPQRDALLKAITPLVGKLRDFGLDGPEALEASPPPPPNSPAQFDYSTEHLNEMLEVVFAKTKAKGRLPVEQRVMLDLARFYDMVRTFAGQD